MAGAIWVVGEAVEGGLARISAEIATLARRLGTESGREAVGIVVGASPGPAAEELATFLPRVIALEHGSAAELAWSTPAASRLVAVLEAEEPALVLVGATPDGRDLAGVLSALLGWGVLGNATGVSWSVGRMTSSTRSGASSAAATSPATASSTEPGCTTTACIQRWSRSRGRLAALIVNRPPLPCCRPRPARRGMASP